MVQIIREENSGVNTVLIVIVLGLIVAFGVWFFGQDRTPAETSENEAPGINVDVNLPTGEQDAAPQEGNGGTPQ